MRSRREILKDAKWEYNRSHSGWEKEPQGIEYITLEVLLDIRELLEKLSEKG
jgi:hypothetical protein